MKKFLSIILAIGILTTTVYAYDFPEPDWGQLLNEKTEMVMEEDFELYVEGNLDSAPYYGAKLEPKAGVYIGMTAEEPMLKFKPLGSYLTYIESYNQSDIYYPAKEYIRSDDVVVMVGWNVYSMDNFDEADARSTLDMLASYNKPMFIRFANEMNVSALGNDPEKYINVFRKVADMVHKYPNFAVVWAPNDLGALDRPYEYYYPGDEYVDWVGVSSYQKMYFNNNPNTDRKDSIYFMTGDFAWHTNAVKPIVEFMEKNNIQKPLMISEGGVTTGNSFGDSSAAIEAWNKPRMRNMYWNLIMKYPQIKMINYFNVHRSGETQTYDISDYSYASNIFKEAAESGAYIKGYGKNPNFVYSRAAKGDTIETKNNIVNLYTLAYLPEKPNITVNYKLDDAQVYSSNEIPYKYGLDISGMADGEHTLTIETEGESKPYKLYKSGKYISFGKMPETGAVGGSDTPNAASNEDDYVYESVYVASEDKVKILLNNRFLQCEQEPVIIDERTLVPLRAIFEALGATVEWDAGSRTAISVKDGKTVTLTIGRKEIIVDGVIKELDVPAMIVNDRTMVPARAVAEAYDCDVTWNQYNRYVIITPTEQKPYKVEVVDADKKVVGTAEFDDKGRLEWFWTSNDILESESLLMPFYVNINGNSYQSVVKELYRHHDDDEMVEFLYEDDNTIGTAFSLYVGTDISKGKTSNLYYENGLLSSDLYFNNTETSSYSKTSNYEYDKGTCTITSNDRAVQQFGPDTYTFTDMGLLEEFEWLDYGPHWTDHFYYDEEGKMTEFQTGRNRGYKYSYNSNGQLAEAKCVSYGDDDVIYTYRYSEQ